MITIVCPVASQVDQTAPSTQDPEFWTDSFRAAIADIGNTIVLLAPFDNPLPISRAWCLFEIATSVRRDIPIAYVSSSLMYTLFTAQLPC